MEAIVLVIVGCTIGWFFGAIYNRRKEDYLREAQYRADYDGWRKERDLRIRTDVKKAAKPKPRKRSPKK